MANQLNLKITASEKAIVTADFSKIDSTYKSGKETVTETLTPDGVVYLIQYTVSLENTLLYPAGEVSIKVSDLSKTIFNEDKIVLPLFEPPLAPNELSSDANTVLLDHFNATTLGMVIGQVSYIGTPPRQAVYFGSDAMIRYDLPGWYRWTENYEPAGKEGTVELWVYPDYGSKSGCILDFQWNKVNTIEDYSKLQAGFILHLAITENRNLRYGAWTSVFNHPPNPPPTPATIPLCEWSYIAASWGPSGTKLYINGKLESHISYNAYPALESIFYVYLNVGGGLSPIYMDEFHVSKIQRSDSEIRSHYIQTEPTPPSLSYLQTSTTFETVKAISPGVISKITNQQYTLNTTTSAGKFLTPPDPQFKIGEIYSYPNPAKAGKNPTLHIECGVADKVKFNLYDIAGELLHSVDITNRLTTVDNKYVYEYPVDISNIPSGVYIYCVEAEKSGEKPIKVIKKFAIIR